MSEDNWDLSHLRSITEEQAESAMAKVRLGMPIHLAAAQIGMMPHELESIYRLIQKQKAEK